MTPAAKPNLVPATYPLRPGDVMTAEGWMRPAPRRAKLAA